MNIALWVAAGFLAVAFLVSGGLKVVRDRDTLRTMGMHWVDDIPPKVIGGLEVLAAVGLVLPALVDVAPVLVPLAATGLVLIMIGAMVIHGRRREWPALGPNLVLLLLAAFVALGRFGPYAF